jgi:hypothetical protein
MTRKNIKELIEAGEWNSNEYNKEMSQELFEKLDIQDPDALKKQLVKIREDIDRILVNQYL